MIKTRLNKPIIFKISYVAGAAALLIFMLGYASARAQNAAAADSPQTIQLWPESRLIKNNDNTFVEHNSSKPGDIVIRLTDITAPTIQIYKPTHANGTAVIVCPGGGYSILAMDLEGVEICKWFNTFGVTAVLLKYRVPAPAGMLNYQLPLQGHGLGKV